MRLCKIFEEPFELPMSSDLVSKPDHEKKEILLILIFHGAYFLASIVGIEITVNV